MTPSADSAPARKLSEVVEIASVDLCSRRLYGVRREIGPGQAEHLVTCGDELRNDG